MYLQQIFWLKSAWKTSFFRIISLYVCDLPKTNSSNINLISCFNFVSGPGAVLVPAPNLVPNPEADPVLDPNLGADLNQLIVMAIQKRTAIATDPRADQDPVLEQNQNLVLGPDLEMTKKNNEFFQRYQRREQKTCITLWWKTTVLHFLFFFPWCCCIVPAFSHRKR